MSDDAALLGHEVIKQGKLKNLRQDLGLSSLAMANFMGVMVGTYRSWERNPDTRLRVNSAQRIGRFYRAAERQVQILSEEGVTVSSLMPLHMAATWLGLTQEGLLHAYRDGQVTATDLGVLGLWVTRDELQRLAA